MTIEERSLSSVPVVEGVRPDARGKFLFVGDQKLYVRGVTYGTFRPDDSDREFHDEAQVERDFVQMAENGVNAVRVYTVPPRWLLDLAGQHGIRVMVGLPWEQHITFLNDHQRARDIVRRVREGVRSCAGHPAVLCYAIGNEIPAAVVRWHGARRVERFLRRLYDAAKDEDPDGLVTYVNYPTTEYLRLDFVDFMCFNVYLERREALDAYLARLHNLAGDLPLVMAEIGLDSLRNGLYEQAHVLDWQIRSIFEGGAAGMFVFAWTDEWYRGGADIDDWDFGLTDRERHPKPALDAVRDAFGSVPFASRDGAWPHISVVVCSHNGAMTIRDCCEGLARLHYPSYEVIVVDDGSTDGTAAIASEYGFRVITTENRGLSAARNTGFQAATGEILAYTDDDARPDEDWLTYLALGFLRTDNVGVGGPNIAPAGDGWIADCVANAPGGPVHVLLSDREAEHIPGCNMAYRKWALEAVGGFDARYRAAGDDVDMCWRLQDCGWTIGFSPTAMVWHHRRNSIKAYWRQQEGYGKAEALLEGKWPERYNRPGHYAWSGRLYGKGLTLPLPFRGPRVYHGSWGTALFQSVYQPGPGLMRSFPLMPEWYLVVAALACLTALGMLSRPLLLVLPLLALAVAAPVLQAIVSARQAHYITEPHTVWQATRLRLLTASLHLLQPLARLRGRLQHGLTPWRRRGAGPASVPWPREITSWRESWQSPETWLAQVESSLRDSGAAVMRGGDYDRWDLDVRGGLLGGARVLMAIEEHGGGHQLARFRTWTHWAGLGTLLAVFSAALALSAFAGRAWIVGAIFTVIAAGTVLVSLVDMVLAAGMLRKALRQQ